MDQISQSKLDIGIIRGCMFQYILIGNIYKYGSSCYSVFSYEFLISSLWRVSYIIQFSLDDLEITLVDHLSYYLSACCIGHPFWPSISQDSQCSTVLGSSPNKCGQIVSCIVFNAVATAFSQIFLGSHSSSAFIMHALISEVSQKVILSDRICIRSVLHLSEETLLLGSPVPTFLSACYLWGFELNTFTTVYSSSNQSTSSAKAQYMILGPYPYNTQLLKLLQCMSKQ